MTGQPSEHRRLAALIEQALRCKSGAIRVPELAESAGFSRFHLSRLFHQTTAETLEYFLRRMRLERAAFSLRHSASSVLEIAVESGYGSPEAFARAFRRAFGVQPSEFRRRPDLAWTLPSPSNLHWNCHWGREDFDALPGALESRVVDLPARRVAVWRALGNYAHLDQAWERLRVQFADDVPRSGRFVTIYLDNMWTHPTLDTMRADIGWPLAEGQPPLGMRIREIPAGKYAVTTREVARHERNDAWSYMCAKWDADRSRRRGLVSYDEYPQWPLPFERVRTRIFVGLPSSDT